MIIRKCWRGKKTASPCSAALGTHGQGSTNDSSHPLAPAGRARLEGTPSGHAQRPHAPAPPLGRTCAQAQARGRWPTRPWLLVQADAGGVRSRRGWSHRRWKSSAPPTGETGCARWHHCGRESCFSAQILWRTR